MYKYYLVEYFKRKHLAKFLNRSYLIFGKTKKIIEVIDNCKKYYIAKPI
jgi:hypothetical protein